MAFSMGPGFSNGQYPTAPSSSVSTIPSVSSNWTTPQSQGPGCVSAISSVPYPNRIPTNNNAISTPSQMTQGVQSQIHTFQHGSWVVAQQQGQSNSSGQTFRDKLPPLNTPASYQSIAQVGSDQPQRRQQAQAGLMQPQPVESRHSQPATTSKPHSQTGQQHVSSMHSEDHNSRRASHSGVPQVSTSKHASSGEPTDPQDFSIDNPLFVVSGLKLDLMTALQNAYDNTMKLTNHWKNQALLWEDRHGKLEESYKNLQARNNEYHQLLSMKQAQIQQAGNVMLERANIIANLQAELNKASKVGSNDPKSPTEDIVTASTVLSTAFADRDKAINERAIVVEALAKAQGENKRLETLLEEAQRQLQASSPEIAHLRMFKEEVLHMVEEQRRARATASAFDPSCFAATMSSKVLKEYPFTPPTPPGASKTQCVSPLVTTVPLVDAVAKLELMSPIASVLQTVAAEPPVEDDTPTAMIIDDAPQVLSPPHSPTLGQTRKLPVSTPPDTPLRTRVFGETAPPPAPISETSDADRPSWAVLAPEETPAVPSFVKGEYVQSPSTAPISQPTIPLEQSVVPVNSPPKPFSVLRPRPSPPPQSPNINVDISPRRPTLALPTPQSSPIALRATTENETTPSAQPNVKRKRTISTESDHATSLSMSSSNATATQSSPECSIHSANSRQTESPTRPKPKKQRSNTGQATEPSSSKHPQKPRVPFPFVKKSSLPEKSISPTLDSIKTDDVKPTTPTPTCEEQYGCNFNTLRLRLRELFDKRPDESFSCRICRHDPVKFNGISSWSEMAARRDRWITLVKHAETLHDAQWRTIQDKFK